MRQPPPKLFRPRIIIMRHSERVDAVLQEPDWPAAAFINGVYSPHRTQLPTVLPFRADPYEHVLDTPLTRYGKAHAHRTGEFFRSIGLIPDIVYSSPAMRCVQTADAVLEGAKVRRRNPIRIDLALHEPIRRELPIQSAGFFSAAGFNVDLHYRPILPGNDPGILLGESRLQYYRRTHLVLKRITDGVFQKRRKMTANPTILVVAHRASVPLLASMLNLDYVDDQLTYLNEIENNKRREVNFLSMIIAEYDPPSHSWGFLHDFNHMRRFRQHKRLF
ncbi:unnamed protein product [Adineta steineri]|uniref:Phosphoglycerate mutase-like protein n=1 Tax=Adineta steineri TaxID=433720 RepID=A0A818JXZ2_9BILA|nr:unnamed protein product [Adineta steineri]CAF0982769.1 unnamed protein product [Adineta steineri]CAF0995722.1 unnamed protein product [Adineta steineri]CAF1181357.1 unnamed protein product [Adineta steineri]CAF1182159.1 unnamed protein product [Adineta steineri]